MLPRRIAIVLAAVVLGLILLARSGDALVDWLWFSSLGYGDVFWTLLVTRSIVFFASLACNGRAAFKLLDAQTNLRAQCFQLQGIFAPPLLKRTKRVADGLAGVLILTCIYDFLDESILFIRQADVARRHSDFPHLFQRKYSANGKLCQ